MFKRNYILMMELLFSSFLNIKSVHFPFIVSKKILAINFFFFKRRLRQGPHLRYIHILNYLEEL